VRRSNVAGSIFLGLLGFVSALFLAVAVHCAGRGCGPRLR
jgi:hypothetical protein